MTDRAIAIVGLGLAIVTAFVPYVISAMPHWISIPGVAIGLALMLYPIVARYARRPRPIPVRQVGEVPNLPPIDFEMRRMTATTATTNAGMWLRVERLNPLRVYPFLRFAYLLENYAGSTNQLDNDNRAIHPGAPQMELHLDNYAAEPLDRRTPFDFGIVNYHQGRAINRAVLTVQFIGGGIKVVREGDWIENRANEEYIFRFQQPIDGGWGLNADGLLRVWFPRRDRYTIRFRITADGLSLIEHSLWVVVV